MSNQNISINMAFNFSININTQRNEAIVSQAEIGQVGKATAHVTSEKEAGFNDRYLVVVQVEPGDSFAEMIINVRGQNWRRDLVVRQIQTSQKGHASHRAELIAQVSDSIKTQIKVEKIGEATDLKHGHLGEDVRREDQIVELAGRRALDGYGRVGLVAGAHVFEGHYVGDERGLEGFFDAAVE